MDIAHCLNEIEAHVGRLSPMQKFLLGTDGSVTQILEAITGEQVVIQTRVQEIVPADPVTAERLGIGLGDPVNYRVVEIGTRGGNVLIHAVSHTPIGRLSPEFKEDLMKADIPIGKIIQNHRIEARREILHARVSPATDETGRIFSLGKREPLLSRQYRIIHDGRPMIFIEEQFPYNRFLDERRVIVQTPSRLHITLIDMHGGSGRVDGGAGITLDEPGILLEVSANPELEVTGCDPVTRQRIMDTAQKVLGGLRIGGSVSVTVRENVPSHIGLGSGSQVMLATARGIAEVYGRAVPVKDLAFLVGRGGTSGIGTAAFEHGGFIIDGGHPFGQGSEKSVFRPSSASVGVHPPPVVVRHEFPPDWRILLAIPHLPPGASGSTEKDIFTAHCPVPLDEVRALCHEILMRMLPGIVERDLDLFGSSVNAIQGWFRKSNQPAASGSRDRGDAFGRAAGRMARLVPPLRRDRAWDVEGQARHSWMNTGRIDPSSP
jgi:beta-ribofuranosylaminobenzene 5'-phosphate synthase